MPEISTGMIVAVTGVSLFGSIFALSFFSKILFRGATSEGLTITRIREQKVSKAIGSLLSLVKELDTINTKDMPYVKEDLRGSVYGITTRASIYLSKLMGSVYTGAIKYAKGNVESVLGLIGYLAKEFEVSGLRQRGRDIYNKFSDYLGKLYKL